ncbi:peptidase inhibitor family I36 protein [Nocardia sp. CDC160]|uniref:peptidase inhibitor family I36 protein n=1 Tax=Nocardia sp. CDC160 TaxID=3112166 RepID=UPI002DBFCE96|nr:peptidase inhibitor family I36 protein [Nocardia sp. CDC160]MEC3919778.1 peptidase inhibitor family I36 protein [Nocardia sp. CDC160]
MKNIHRAKSIRGAIAAAALAVGTVSGGALVAAAPASAAGYDCPGGMFCAWDNVDGTGSMIVQVDNGCFLHDIGNAGYGDRMVSYWNRTGKTVDVLNWNGKNWELLAHVPDATRATLPVYAQRKADAVKVCA